MNAESISRLAAEYCAHTGLRLSTVSTYAANHGALLGRLAGTLQPDGTIRRADITTRRAARIVRWLDDHWPAGAEWPADIPRPSDAHAGHGPVRPAAGTIPHTPAPGAAGAAPDAATAEPTGGGERPAPEWRLNGRGCIADAGAVLAHCGGHPKRRYVLDTLVARYRDDAQPVGADGRTLWRHPTAGSLMDRLLRHLVAAGDVRFSARRAYLDGLAERVRSARLSPEGFAVLETLRRAAP